MQTPTLIFLNLRKAHFRNAWTAMRTMAVTRMLTIVASCLVTWVTLFCVSLYGFHEMKTRFHFPLDGPMQEVLFDVMFFLLSSLLLFSTSILLYSGLFTSPESRFLLTSPLPDDHVFAYKFQGALAFSNWGFLLLGSPVLIAFGLCLDPAAPASFFVFLPLYFLGFVLIPGSLGALVCMALVNFLPRNVRQVAKVAVAIVAVVAVVWFYRALRDHSTGFQPTRLWFETFMNRLGSLSGFLWPHHWVAGGLCAAATGQTEQALYYLALIWSNGLLLYVIAVWAGKRLFRRGVERILTGGSLMASRVRSFWLDRVLEKGLVFLDVPTRQLIVKDLRTFRRDPAQWLQIFIFVALLVSYFSAMRSFFDRDVAGSFKNGISLLTLTAASLLTCAYTGRFVFPMLSLEGRTFWLLGLLPISRSRLVWGKFAFSTLTCLIPCATLIVTCDLILAVPTELLLVHAVAVALVAIGLSGISVSMGTYLPNFRENDPSKIAIGFGGTLNLVLGFLYILIVLGLVALPPHVNAVRAELGQSELPAWIVWTALGAGVTLGIAGAFVPIRMASRHLERMEF